MIDKNKTYRTRDGREVRIYATDAGGSRPVHGSVACDESWNVFCWLPDGSYSKNGKTECDLIEVVPLIERWAVVTPEGSWYASYHDQKTAEQVRDNERNGFRIAHLREVRE